MNEFIAVIGQYRYRWWMRPLCWFRGHRIVPSIIFGVGYEQCSRCGKDFWNNEKVINIRDRLNHSISSGIIGELHSVVVYRTKGIKKRRKR